MVLLLLGALPGIVSAAPPKYVTWTARVTPNALHPGEGAQVVLTAHIAAGWHLYSLTQPPGGPLATTITVEPGPLTQVGAGVQPPPTKQHDAGFNMTIEIYHGAVAFGVPVTVKAGPGATSAHIKVRSQLCNASTCLPPDTVELTVPLKVVAGKPKSTKPITATPKVMMNVPATAGTVLLVGDPQTGSDAYAQKESKARSQGLLSYILLAFVAGFGALLTPCVFPMIPITVSFFAKRRDSFGKNPLSGPLAYCGGIVTTFTGLGLIVTVLFGATGIQHFATNPYVNVALGILFLVLAANLLGVFEIAAPTWIANRANNRAQQGGILAPMLMGLTFTVTSFTCTVPFVGTLLASAARGSFLYPVVGMLAFSSAFALPFFLLALFPQAISKLPRAGTWMVSFKAFMGLVEIAAALKFLSNADLVWQRGLLTRPLFLGIWAILAVIGSLYLLGWVRFPHDMEGGKIGWMRRVFGVGTAVVGIMCLAAIQGTSLGIFNSYLPPDPYPSSAQLASAKGKPNGPEPWIQDYAQGLEKAHETGKPILVNFTGVTCTNCRLMENNMFPRPEITKELDQYVKVELYTDRDTPADNHNKDLEEKLTGVVTLPVYVALSPDGKVRKVFQGMTTSAPTFARFLVDGRAAGPVTAMR
jgi:thiol:disulfide interchange protein DsbD